MHGRRLLRKKVFLARPELDLLMSELNTLNSLLNSPQGVRRALQLAAGTRVDPASFFTRPAEEMPRETMDVFLMKKGIPCQQGLLKLTREEIEHMPEERRAALRERIGKSVLPALLNACNDDRVFTWLNDLEFGWLSDDLFPRNTFPMMSFRLAAPRREARSFPRAPSGSRLTKAGGARCSLAIDP
jgi:hypothetical protein